MMLECEGGLDSLFALIGEEKDEGQSVYAGHTNTLITYYPTLSSLVLPTLL